MKIALSEMTSLHVDEGPRNDAIGFLNNADLSKVVLWDCGPSKPLPPVRPKPPKGTEGEPEFDLARLEFRDELEAYDAALRKYATDRRDYQAFMTRWGGPHEIVMWSADAQDALRNDASAVEDRRQERPRYFISARTRGREGLINGGLPETMKPGPGHEREMERIRQTGVDLKTLQRRDPVFGEQRTFGS